MKWIRDPNFSAAAFLLSFAVALVVSSITIAGPQSLNRRPRILQQSTQADPYHPIFEFAPTSGTGMGTACACTTPTGLYGESMTFLRASSGTCLKGNTTSSIANGDLVTCTNNQPRVMPGLDGTGPLGMLSEGPRTNTIIRSQEFDNAAWTQSADNPSRNPVVTSNAAIAPDGTMTADRLQVPTTTGVQFSQVFQGGCSGANPETASIFLKGVSGSGTLDLALQGGAVTCKACPYVAGSWTRCDFTVTNAATNYIIGSSAVYGGACLGAAADTYIWGGDCEAGAMVSSYIATTSATVTRVGESASFSLPTWRFTTGSLALSWLPGNFDTNATPIPYELTENSSQLFYGNYSFGKWRAVLVNVTVNTKTSTANLVANAANRIGGQINSRPTLFDCLAGTCESIDSNATLNTLPQTLYVGSFAGTSDWAYGVVKQVCLDNSPTRCQ